MTSETPKDETEKPDGRFTPVAPESAEDEPEATSEDGKKTTKGDGTVKPTGRFTP